MDYMVSDVRLLVAIIEAAGHQPATIAEVMAAGGVTDRAALTADELFGGLRRLIRGGRIRMIGNRYEPTPSMRVSIRERVDDDVSRTERVRAVEDMLQVPAAPPIALTEARSPDAQHWQRLADQ